MTPKDHDYVQLQIGLSTTKRAKWIIALRATADYYGWTKEFPRWRSQSEVVINGKTFMQDPGRRSSLMLAGGNRHRICRSPSTAGQPAGLTNQFRVSTSCGVLDLAELAHFTLGDWHWMEGLHGERIRRDRWEDIYQAGH